MPKENKYPKLTTSIIITNATNIQIKFLVEDIQQLKKKRQRKKRDSTAGLQVHNIPNHSCV